eukprot:11162377-Lingulodinium_polyedra.AAC.1
MHYVVSAKHVHVCMGVRKGAGGQSGFSNMCVVHQQTTTRALKLRWGEKAVTGKANKKDAFAEKAKRNFAAAEKQPERGG